MTQALRAKVEERLRDQTNLDGQTLDRAVQLGERTRRPIEQVLNQLGSLTDADLVQLYQDVLALPVWNPADQPPAAPGRQVSVDFLRRSRLIVVEAGDDLTCAACDPLDQDAVDGLAFALGGDLNVLIARPSDWRKAFDATFPEAAGSESAPLEEARLERDLEAVDERGGDSAGGRLVASVFETAIAAGASDIHFEPARHGMAIRLRIDGRLHLHRTVSLDLAAPAVSRVKVIANLDLGERRLPQDGRTTMVIAGRQVDVRVATGPTVFGETAVLRILDRASIPLDLAALGLRDEQIQILSKAATLQHGMFLVSGPTGSGKTTTLYSILQMLAGSPQKILSVEDPVEYHFGHVSQTQVAPQVGLTFARVLRSFLRQNPNIILVGEIRDPETASVALQAAMTGHLVLASIHANDASGVLARLLDMGIEPFQLNAAFRGASAQRLVRKLCKHCSVRRPPTSGETEIALAANLPAPRQLYDSVGCPACKETGFTGRLAISEAFLADYDTVRALVAHHQSGGSQRVNDPSRTMLQDGLLKAEDRSTTYEEVLTAVNA